MDLHNESETVRPKPDEFEEEPQTPSPTIDTSESDKIKYPSKDGTYLSQFYNQPLVTTLTSFSHVANLVRNPYELINNVDEFVRQASGNSRKHHKTKCAKSLNQNRRSTSPSSLVLQEMYTFVGSPNDQSSSTSYDKNDPLHNIRADELLHKNEAPIPALPPIECSSKRGRLEPLTIEEYEKHYRLTATDLELVERIFFGGISCNQLRTALMPYLFGLILHRGKFEKSISSVDGSETYVFEDHEANKPKWEELDKLYNNYQNQWKAILPDQETRFSAFRERKSLIERDVIRCDRLHPFYAEIPQNLSKLTCLLMSYMMYDFDIGYVQGMSDLAGPILYMYQGDIVKSFWIFVEVMKLFRRNFELTQKTIHFQLGCLYQLIKNTDPIFAQYLEENDSSNCFFAFRAIVCLFKRELMKEDEDDYSNVLFLWDTIWCVKRRADLQEEFKSLMNDEMQLDESGNKSPDQGNKKATKTITEQPTTSNTTPFAYPYNPNQADSIRYHLTETEIFVLSLCLSMIRRERDLIMANKLDATDIHLHFIDPKLASDLNGFIEHAINIHSFIKNDFDINKLISPKNHESSKNANPESPPGSAEGYDLLSDFLIINGASGS